MRKHAQRSAARVEADLSTSQGTNDLIFYLVSHFIAVLAVVMLLESLVVGVESVLFLPAMEATLRPGGPVDVQVTASPLELVYRTFVLLRSLARADLVMVVGFARGSMAVLFLVGMLALLALPPVMGAVVFSRMVVRRVRDLQQRRERELALIDQQRSQFLTDIAHDLRTPLMAISGMAHALSDGMVRDDAMREEYLASICDKTDKMGTLVSSVFDYTKLGSGSFALERERIDLPQLLLREAAVVYTDVEEAGMHFSVEVPEDPCAIDADPVQLARVVSNLLVNAVRHNEPGCEIALALVRQAGVAYVVVADTGERIEKDPEELFRPFSRGDAARLESGGSGLGLSICKRIADLHGCELVLVQPYGRFAKAFVLQCAVLPN